MRFALFGAIGAFCAVALGAFGAHALRHRLAPALLETFEVGVRYQMYHSLALFAVAWLVHRNAGRWADWAGVSFLVGILLFSGSLYAYVLSERRAFAMITPVGGLCFLLGWGLLAWVAWQARNS